MNRARAKAIAIAKRRPDPLPWWPWVLMLLSLLAAGSVFGQTAAPGSGSPLVPPTAGAPDTPGGTTRNGVATPSVNRDPGIVTAVPSRPASTPVIPPPGSPGGNPNVVPK